MPEVRNFTQGAPAKEQNQPGMFPTVQQLTCPCGWIMAVHRGSANCPTCGVVYQVTVATRPMTDAEMRIATAHLRGERLPVAEPTVTQMEGLR